MMFKVLPVKEYSHHSDLARIWDITFITVCWTISVWNPCVVFDNLFMCIYFGISFILLCYYNRIWFIFKRYIIYENKKKEHKRNPWYFPSFHLILLETVTVLILTWKARKKRSKLTMRECYIAANEQT